LELVDPTDWRKFWEPMRIVLEHGRMGRIAQKFNGVSDANIVVDETNGTIFVAGLWMHGVNQRATAFGRKTWRREARNGTSWRTKGSQPGLDVKQTSSISD